MLRFSVFLALVKPPTFTTEEVNVGKSQTKKTGFPCSVEIL